MSDVVKNAAVATFKKDRTDLKGKITRACNKAKDVIEQEGPLEQVRMGLAGAKQHLTELKDCLAKMRSYHDPGLPADKDVIKEGEDYVQTSVLQVEELENKLQGYHKYMKQKNFDLGRQHVDVLRENLEKNLRDNAAKELIREAALQLEQYQEKLRAATSKMLNQVPRIRLEATMYGNGRMRIASKSSKRWKQPWSISRSSTRQTPEETSRQGWRRGNTSWNGLLTVPRS